MLTITNWNIERVFPRSRRWKRVEELLNQLQADVVVLTEAHTSMSPGKGFNGVFGGKPYGEFRQGEVRCAIWSQFELQSLSELGGDLPDCAAARLNHPIYGGISVFACILPYLGRSWQGIPTKGGQAFQSALADFRAAWHTIVDRFPEDTLIVAGDFNQSITRSHYYGSYIQRAALERVLAEDDLNILTAMDDDPVMRASHPHACIDHICVSRSANFQLLQSERWPDTAAPDRSLSDHFAIKVQLEK
jgi:endonuclease/exonuclease/phosphatase family metal-dependent hydrolase